MIASVQGWLCVRHAEETIWCHISLRGLISSQHILIPFANYLEWGRQSSSSSFFYCCFVLLCLSSTFPISLFWDQWNFLLIYTRVSIWIYFCSYACVDIESELIPKIGSDVNFRVSKSEEIIISWMLFSCQHIGLLSVCTLERIGNVLRTLFMCTCEW